MNNKFVDIKKADKDKRISYLMEKDKNKKPRDGLKRINNVGDGKIEINGEVLLYNYEYRKNRVGNPKYYIKT